MLQKTHFGWIVADRLDSNIHLACDYGVRAFHASVTDTELQNQLSRFWQLEEDFRYRDSYLSIDFASSIFAIMLQEIIGVA